ncbi:MAG: tRNA (N(6)-L-threonylcarbamoyladenosine(37)-C(2))-methylthiotransferase MtaB [Pseudomonadota bacterium]
MSAPDIITLGCRLNAHDSEAMRRLAAKAGARDAVVVNTCAVTNEAVRQARQTIRRARRERPGARLVVTGCAAQIDPDGFAAMPEVDAVLGNEEKLRAEEWRRIATDFGVDDAENVRVDDIMAVRESAPQLIDGFGEYSRAFVQVQTGCDHRCTFCIIPYGRGNARSVPVGAVVDQVKRLVDAGYYEVVLTGVDITSYGPDLPGAPDLGALVAKVLDHVPDLPRLRLSSIDGAEIDGRLFERIAHDGRVAPHLHLSLQAGDDMILKRMKRRHTRAQAVEICARLREARPEIAFGADLIAGFPTETEEMFQNSVNLVEDCGLAYVHVFPFSPREGTPAARMPQLERAVVKERAARLRETAEAALIAHLDALVGTEQLVLAERNGRGRLPNFAECRFLTTPAPGALVPARMTRRDGARLVAEEM